ncbi:MAG: hypothetical protein QOF61_540 [Acidobacteriota bacterium]|jgi:hypothetical protein|nr:hypothetical protein [Acidobacteriota bacterium]
MGLLSFFRRGKVDAEAERRTRLLRTGRIADGTIFDVGTDDGGDITHIFYSYNISGVEYESSQTLNDAQRQRPADYSPGAGCTVRYDPHQPANSVVV